MRDSARTVIECLAHNVARWTALLGLSDPTPRAARTLRRRPLTDFTDALTRIRALPTTA